MKNISPKKLATRISLIVSCITAIAAISFIFLSKEYEYLLLIIAILSVFVVSYIITFRVITNFILEKINPIYKSILDLNLPDRIIRKKFEEKDAVKEVNKDVIDWAKKRQKEIKKLKNQEKYRKEFLGNVSHELKTPIFNIQGYILTLLDGGIEDSEINKSYLQKAEKSINRMISIVEDLEHISELESEVLKLKIKKLNIVSLFKEAFEMQEMHAKERKIKLVFNTDYDKQVLVKADREKILNVINNLLNNSIKYGKEKGKTKVSFMDMGNHILVEVADNGIGIAKKDIPRIFERFYRTDKGRSRDMGGTGLGLSIVKHIIEAHNQTINVRSTKGEGSSFTFTLEKA
ncbi:MAG: sensor histidine kinase [Bacteroidales bacterium]|nr:sensor histidine kinase [Bacteroidales bacterium]